MISTVFLGLGTNIGNRERFLNDAVKHLSQHESLEIVRFSSCYETEPVGEMTQGRFLNQVVEVKCSLKPEVLLGEIKSIEKEIGRTDTYRWGPREIDIDILFYGGLTVDSSELSIPHRELRNRRFVLEPLAEIAPEFICPQTGMTVSALLKQCTDTGNIEKMTCKHS